MRRSCRYQNGSSQQVEVGLAITLPSQHLEPVDLALSLAAAPGFNERGAHRGAVLLQRCGERLDGANAARAHLGELSVQVGHRRDGVRGLVWPIPLAFVFDEQLLVEQPPEKEQLRPKCLPFSLATRTATCVGQPPETAQLRPRRRLLSIRFFIGAVFGQSADPG